MSSGASSGISNGTSGAQGNMEQMNSENAALQNESNLSSTMPNHSQAVTPKENSQNILLIMIIPTRVERLKLMRKV